MAYPEFDKPFVLHTDASQEGLGAVLYQRQDGIMRVIGYASRTITPAEQNYYLQPGKTRKDADFLSRMPKDISIVMTECTEEVSPFDIKATICTEASAPNWSNSAWITSLTVDEKVIDTFFRPPTKRKHWPINS
eukprot:gene17596-9235_t